MQGLEYKADFVFPFAALGQPPVSIRSFDLAQVSPRQDFKMVLIIKHCIAAVLSATFSLALTLPISRTLRPREFGLPMSQRADASLTGYLGTFFLGNEPDVYFYLSNGNNPLSFTALNGGSPILVPTEGTGGVRDPAIAAGGGNEAGKKWYIVGTDLDISKVSRFPYPRTYAFQQGMTRA